MIFLLLQLYKTCIKALLFFSFFFGNHGRAFLANTTRSAHIFISILVVIFFISFFYSSLLAILFFARNLTAISLYGRNSLCIPQAGRGGDTKTGPVSRDEAGQVDRRMEEEDHYIFGKIGGRSGRVAAIRDPGRDGDGDTTRRILWTCASCRRQAMKTSFRPCTGVL